VAAYDVDMTCPGMHDPSGLERAIDEFFGPAHRRGTAHDRDPAAPRKKEGLFKRIFKRKRGA
jgi:hypothetical protein